MTATRPDPPPSRNLQPLQYSEIQPANLMLTEQFQMSRPSKSTIPQGPTLMDTMTIGPHGELLAEDGCEFMFSAGTPLPNDGLDRDRLDQQMSNLDLY